MRFGSRFLQIETEKQNFPHMLFFKQKTRHDYERKNVCCCEIANDVHWLMLIETYKKKCVVCPG